MVTTALVWLLTLLVLATSAYLYGVQITRLRNKMFNGDLTMPLCRTRADIVRRVPEEAAALFPALEDGRFRSCHVAVFSPGGEVYLDSLQPCRGKLPMPHSARQKETFSRLKEKGVLDAGAEVDEERAKPVLGPRRAGRRRLATKGLPRNDPQRPTPTGRRPPTPTSN